MLYQKKFLPTHLLWLINGSRNTRKSFISNPLECLNRNIDKYSKMRQNRKVCKRYVRNFN